MNWIRRSRRQFKDEDSLKVRGTVGNNRIINNTLAISNISIINTPDHIIITLVKIMGDEYITYDIKCKASPSHIGAQCQHQR